MASVTSTYTATISGSAADVAYSWSVPVVPAGGLVQFSTTNTRSVVATFSANGVYVLQCRVTSSSAADQSLNLPVTFNTSTNTCNIASHSFSIGNEISFLSNSGILPIGLLERTPYYILSSGFTSNAFTVGVEPGGSVIDISGSASGTYRVVRVGRTALYTVTVSGITDLISGGRISISFTTGVLAQFGVADFTMNVGKLAELLSVQLSEPSWVRLYRSSAQRAADTRSSPGGTLQAMINLRDNKPYSENVTTTAGQTIIQNPVSIQQGDSSGLVYVRLIKQSAGSSVVTLTITIFPQEA